MWAPAARTGSLAMRASTLRNLARRALPVVGAAAPLIGANYALAQSKADGSRRRYVTAPIRCEDGTTVIPWSTPSRAEMLERLQTEEFDLLVVGGGCVGAGVAWEASTRGLKVALVERDDFAAGTSGRSTKLIHGGIRYLESAFKNLDIGMLKLVQEALSERAHLMNAAPFMAKPLPTIIPIYTYWEIPYMWAGAKVYDMVAAMGDGKGAVPSAYYINKDEALYQFPMLNGEGLKGAVVYYDGQHNDTRMNVLIALTACQAGAAAANYVEVTNLTHDATGKTSGATVKDTHSGKSWSIKAKGVINATGPFGDGVRLMDDPTAQPLIVGASGVHLILPDHFSPDNMGLIIPKTRDGRVLFFLPWEGMTVVGTTDHPAEISMSPAPEEDDVRFILDEANRYLNRKINASDVKAAWSGIRPLVKDPARMDKGTAAISREHVVEVSKKTGLVSILGGKWTTYRKMAEDAVDALAKEKKLDVAASKTLKMQVLGADRAGVVFNQKFDRIPVTLRESYALDKDVSRHLARNYGTRALQVAQIASRDPKLARRLAPKYPVLAAEVAFAVEQEYAQTIVDVIARRTRLAYLDAKAAADAVPAVIEIMAGPLGWDAARKKQEVAEAAAFLRTMVAPSAAADVVKGLPAQ